MSEPLDETAGDLPVRDVGLRGGTAPLHLDADHDTRSWRRPPQVLKLKERQRLLRASREQLEDQCLRLHEENLLLKQHTRTQEQKMRRLSTRVLRLKHGVLSTGRDGELEDTIQELEARVAALESQKGALQGKLNLARQHILDLGVRVHTRPRTGRGADANSGVRRAAQTAPARCGHSSLEDTQGDIDRLSTVLESRHGRVAELESTAQSLRETLKDKEKEMESVVKDLRKHQADAQRLVIKDNVDVIRLQKQLSEKSAALLVVQGKFSSLQEAYEKALDEGQTSLKESHGALLEKLEDLREQLKEEKQRCLQLEARLNSATLSLQSLGELQERVTDLEEERNLLKKSYDSLLESTVCVQNIHERASEQLRESSGDVRWREHVQRMEETLEEERKKRRMLEDEKKAVVEKDEQQVGDLVKVLRQEHVRLEQEVLHHRQEVSALQEKLDSVTNEFDMSVEDLSETLLQIKRFRMQKEAQGLLGALNPQEKCEETSRELTAVRASYAETVLELQKTRGLLSLQHRLNVDLQGEMKILLGKSESQRKDAERRAGEKDKLLKSRGLQISALQAQLEQFSYSPRHCRRTIPLQYTWTGLEQPTDHSTTLNSRRRAGESLLEVHLTGATFTPLGLRLMHADPAGLVTFCTCSFLDYETLSTALMSGAQPSYGFTSYYSLSRTDIEKLRLQSGSLAIELHQAFGGVRFVTRGGAIVSLMGALQCRGERVRSRTNVTGTDGEVVGILEFWVCLHPQKEPKESGKADAVCTTASEHTRSSNWAPEEQEEVFDYGGGIPNELEVVVERCTGLSTHWPGLLPDAYLTYRLYDLPAHSTHIVPGCVDPVFQDAAVYPLAVSVDVVEYLSVGSLWVYLFDDSESQTPQTYLAKTPIPLRPLASGRAIRGDYVLRDPAGGARGTVRVSLRWRFPFKSVETLIRGGEEQEKQMLVHRSEDPPRPIAKPRLQTPSDHRAKTTEPLFTPRRPPERGAATVSPTKRTPSSQPGSPPAPAPTRPIHASLTEERRRHHREKKLVTSSDQEYEDKEMEDRTHSDADESSGSDVIIVPHPPKPRKKSDRLRVEILSLSFNPTSVVALDQSVHQVYVEYRLVGVPMETTETPVSLRKPTEGEEIHFNFTRVIHVESAAAAPLRQYLCTVMEGTDPNHGRLKFSVVSEPLTEEEECQDVGYAYLDLRELLLSGNDVIEQQINIVSVGVEQDVVGKLKVSVEAAKALTGICREHHHTERRERSEPRDAEKRAEEELHVLDVDDEF